ncbi:unnamed protein product [Nippostrongylus brasiliensis]|uniref:Uncharacterized protein n=1 Tax=Nippostrongylus brasiliensis TaxID=27835 RepID=A0A0N4XMB3_NIPBR|nr:unnamed protein product [Nippostrongylus brasiliensis]
MAEETQYKFLPMHIETMDAVATMTVNTLYMNKKHTIIMQKSVQIDVETVAGNIESSWNTCHNFTSQRFAQYNEEYH